MSIKTHTTVWTQPHGTADQERTALGAWVDATADLSNVTIHDIVDIQRSTRTVQGNKVTTITLVASDGTCTTIDAHRAEA